MSETLKPYAYLRHYSVASSTEPMTGVVHYEGRYRLSIVGLGMSASDEHQRDLNTRFEACFRAWLAEKEIPIHEASRCFETSIGQGLGFSE